MAARTTAASADNNLFSRARGVAPLLQVSPGHGDPRNHHKAGRAVDVRTRGHSASSIRSFINEARHHGITVIDERGGGNSAWTGPHVHLQK
jgi:hypothetical protein